MTHKLHYIFALSFALLLTACGDAGNANLANTKVGTCDPDNVQGFNCECLTAKLAEGQHGNIETLLDDLAKTRRKHVDTKIPDMSQSDINALIDLAYNLEENCEF